MKSNPKNKREIQKAAKKIFVIMSKSPERKESITTLRVIGRQILKEFSNEDMDKVIDLLIDKGKIRITTTKYHKATFLPI